MKYKCNDVFMIRVPSLSSENFLDFIGKDENEMIEFIKQNDFYNFFVSSILISSTSLFEVLDKKFEDNLKMQSARDISLVKFFIRTSTRPTPYGLYAGIALGEFSDIFNNKKLKIDSKKIKIECRVDGLWLALLVRSLENDSNIYPDLKVKFNKNCYVSGDRLKNPYYSGHGLSKLENSEIRRVNIKNTKLISYIKKETNDFISYNSLANNIKKIYKGISQEIVVKTINLLLENEILLTNLRPQSSCENELKHILEVLEPIKGTGEVTNVIREINEMIKLINYFSERNKIDILIIKKVYTLMRGLVKEFDGKNYLVINMGIVLEENVLPNDLKNHIERFVDGLSFLNTSSYMKLDTFKKAFNEEYGDNVEVPLYEIIDENKFDGLQYLKNYHPNYIKNDIIIKKIVDEKILYCLQNGFEEVNLTKKDFDIGKFETEIELPNSFDMNFFITQDDEKYNIFVSPIIGSVFGGQMFNRFANIYEGGVLGKYRSLNNKDMCTDEDTILVEIREYSSNARINNINSKTFNHKYYFAGSVNEESKEVQEIVIDDIYIGSYNGRFYIKSKSMNKVCKMVHDSMINPV